MSVRRNQLIIAVHVALALLILSEGSAWARATASSRTIKRPKTYRQYITLCKNRPDIPACRRASFYFGKLGKKSKGRAVKQFAGTVKKHLALRKASKRRARMAERMRDNRGNYWRRAWSKVRFKVMRLKAAWFGTSRRAAVVKPAGPFTNTGGFGHYVHRTATQKHNSWVYKAGRLKVANRPGAKKKTNSFKRRRKKK